MWVLNGSSTGVTRENQVIFPDLYTLTLNSKTKIQRSLYKAASSHHPDLLIFTLFLQEKQTNETWGPVKKEMVFLSHME